MVTPQPFRTPCFLVRWIAAGSFVWLLGGVLAHPVAYMVSSAVMPAPQGKIDDITAGLLGMLVSVTLILGLGSTIQAVLLRERIPQMLPWIVLSSLGGVCGSVVGLFLDFVLSLPMVILMDVTIGHLVSAAVSRDLALLLVGVIAMVVMGAILGAFQCIVVGRPLPQTTVWIWASALGLMVGLLMAALTIQRITPSVAPLGLAWWTISCGVSGSVYSIITSIALRWLFSTTPDAQLDAAGLQ